MPKYKGDAYLRLSYSADRSMESDSIANQRSLLKEFAARQPDLQVIDQYSDDGFTGTNFQRPDFQRMIADIEAGKINCVIVKDLSRFGRDYINSGRYLERWFPEHGVRFLAVNDHIDSENGPYDMLLPFKNVFNEQYARDISNKVKSAMQAKQRQGQFIGAFASYGYRKDPEDHNKLLIDPCAAAVVQRIFDLYEQGNGKIRIAKLLNEEGIPCPSKYKKLNGERYHNGQRLGKTTYWTYATIHRMLKNQMYIGNMEQGRAPRQIMHGRAKQLDRSQWTVVEGTHEPIITREIWDTVVSIDQKKVRKSETSDGIKSIFTGLVYCADCGFKMRNQVERFTYKDGSPGRYSSFMCGSYSRSGKSACTIHTIYENVLTQIVLEDIREKARYAAHDRERLLTQIIRMKDKEQHSRAASYEQELKVTAARVAELEKLMQNLYEDKCAGVVPPTVFQTLMKKYETERAQKAAALPELEQKVRTQLENRHDADQWAEIIRRYTEITELDETILFELVDRIEVGEAQKCGNTRVQDVKVFYRYVGCVDDALSQERRAAV